MDKFSILHCDFYHLTMAQALFDSKQYKNIHNTTDSFEMFYRRAPFKGSYAIVAGISDVVELLKNWHITDEEIEYLSEIKSQSGKSMFTSEFLKFLKNSKMELSVEAMTEGDVVFPNEPILRVTGPSWQAFMVESMILNIINAQSIIATKASRIYSVAKKGGKQHQLLDFTLRRSLSSKGISETKAAFIGGFDITSNVYAAQKYNLPVSGTHAHSLVMKYGDELDAFVNYLKAMPDNAILLVDTYDSISGVKNAIEAAKFTKTKLQAIRLDSGDLGYLAKKARLILDNAGLKNTKIIATNDLDEFSINSLLNEQNAPIDIFGAGTKLAIVEQGLGGVYKLKTTDGIDKIKIAEQEIKTTIPGMTDTIRLINDEGLFMGDVIIPAKGKFIEDGVLIKDLISYNLANSRYKIFEKGTSAKTLLSPIFEKGKLVDDITQKPLIEVQQFKINNFEKLDEVHKRLYSPHLYVAGLEKSLYTVRKKMIERITERSL